MFKCVQRSRSMGTGTSVPQDFCREAEEVSGAVRGMDGRQAAPRKIRQYRRRTGSTGSTANGTSGRRCSQAQKTKRAETEVATRFEKCGRRDWIRTNDPHHVKVVL